MAYFYAGCYILVQMSVWAPTTNGVIYAPDSGAISAMSRLLSAPASRRQANIDNFSSRLRRVWNISQGSSLKRPQNVIFDTAENCERAGNAYDSLTRCYRSLGNWRQVVYRPALGLTRLPMLMDAHRALTAAYLPGFRSLAII